MMEREIDWNQRRGEGHHRTAAIVASVLSILLHGAGMFYFSDIRLNVVVALPQKLDEQVYKKIRVFDVAPEAIKKKKKQQDRIKDDIARQAQKDHQDIADVPVDKSRIEPPPPKDVALESVMQNMTETFLVPNREEWQPRQEILDIRDKIASDNAAVIPRRLAPQVERVAKAPDYVSSVDMNRMGKAGAAGGGVIARPGGASIEKGATVEGLGATVASPLESDKPQRDINTLFDESLTEITNIKAIEKYLVAVAEVYTPMTDFRYGYFKIEIRRAGPEAMSVLPKDILFVQDSSASITEQRLYFCREALQACIGMIGPDDRFNVMSFKDQTTLCFSDWQKRSKESIDTAKDFVSKLNSSGNTDIYASMIDILKVKRDSSRPFIAFVVTDGMSNTGITKSSNIIGEFSKLNEGKVSVFMMGTTKSANTYLLDLMGYSNKGGVFNATGGRWGIPEVMQNGVREISRPVMAEVKFRFAAGSDTEVYPLLAGNLYLDRSMVLYGRYHKKGAGGIVFQAVGDAMNGRCDMIFDLPLDKSAPQGDKDIRTEWAKQKIYHLIGEYTRSPDPEILKQIKTTAKMYRVDIPYEGKF